MENLACIVFVFAIYCTWAIAAYSPKPAPKPTITPAPKPITPKPVAIVEPKPIAAFTAPPAPVMATEKQLLNQPIRTLKTLAKGRIKRYSSLTKAQLSEKLAGIVPLSELG